MEKSFLLKTSERLRIIKTYNISGIMTHVFANPGELKLQLFYEDVDFELLQAKGWCLPDAKRSLSAVPPSKLIALANKEV